METAISTLSQLPETKQQIETFAYSLEQGLNNGQIIASDLLRFQKAIEKVFEKIKPTLIENALNEISNYEKNAVIKGSEFSIVEAGVKYDYSECNDVEHNKLTTQIEALKSTLKDRETFLKAIKAPMQMIDENSGEVYTICPPKKTSTTTLKVTFK
jgi:nucleotidyltransferase/DNA polymerase involved in DNA repair